MNGPMNMMAFKVLDQDLVLSHLLKVVNDEDSDIRRVGEMASVMHL